MSDRVTSVGLTAFLFLLVGAMTWMAVDFNEEARRVPLVVGIPTTIGLAIQLARDLLAFRLSSEEGEARSAEGSGERMSRPEGVRPNEQGAEAAEAQAKAGSTTKTERADIPTPEASVPQAFAWILALAFSFYLLGMLATVPVFLISFMRFYGNEDWKIVIGAVVGTMGVLYLFFVQLLEVRLYSGVVIEWLGL